MVIVTLLAIAKIWKQSKCPSMDECIKKLHIHISIYLYRHNGILFSHKNNEILPCVTTQMDFQGIMLSEISQRKTNII